MAIGGPVVGGVHRVRPGSPGETVARREAVQLYTKAALKRLGWTAVVILVAWCVFLVAMFAERDNPIGAAGDECDKEQPGSSSPTRAWIPGRCNTTWATRTSSTPFDIPSFHPIGSVISGKTRPGRRADCPLCPH